jgi:hypothetical protein
MKTIFNAIGSPSNPVLYLLKINSFLVVGLPLYILMVSFGVSPDIALIATAIVLIIASRLIGKVKPQSLHLEKNSDEGFRVSGRFVEGRISDFKKEDFICSDYSDDKIELTVGSETKPKKYTMNTTNFKADSLKTIAEILKNFTTGEFGAIEPSTPNLRIHNPAGKKIFNFHEKPSFVVLSFLSLSISMGLLLLVYMIY